MTDQRNQAPAYSLPVYSAADFTVIEGANLGDPLSHASELMLDDVYSRALGSSPIELAIDPRADARYRIAETSQHGQRGAPVHLDCTLTLMTPDGKTTDALVLVETHVDGTVSQIYMLPFAPIVPRTPYALVGIDTDTAPEQLAQRACARFTRGTRITMASGEQRPIEQIALGDRVLTRDAGPQPVRWIGLTTQRATGDFAPICIRQGALNNTADLFVSPDHRLFIYQRQDRLGAGRSELLVKARHLVNGDTVVVQDGGYVDYFQLLFDSHQIIYAEGISAESMLIDTRTEKAVPPEVAARLKQTEATIPPRALDVQEQLLKRPDAAEILRRASSS